MSRRVVRYSEASGETNDDLWRGVGSGGELRLDHFSRALISRESVLAYITSRRRKESAAYIISPFPRSTRSPASSTPTHPPPPEPSLPLPKSNPPPLVCILLATTATATTTLFAFDSLSLSAAFLPHPRTRSFCTPAGSARREEHFITYPHTHLCTWRTHILVREFD